MTQDTLHIVFTAASDLCKALAEERPRDLVLALSDCLSFGPIKPFDPLVRARWVESELGYDDWREIVTEAEAFWSGAFVDDRHRTVWMSRRSTQEYSGFLEFIWRNADKPFDVVDLTKLTVSSQGESGELGPPSLVGTLALLRAEEIIENKLWDRAAPLSAEQLEGFRRQWESLRNEDAPLRVLDNDLKLLSAPISHFDNRLLSSATREWQKAAFIIGDVLADFLDEPRRFQVDDLVLASRLRTLIANGALEGKGDLSELQSTWVRLLNSAEGA